MSRRKWTASLLVLFTLLGGAYFLVSEETEAFTVPSPFKGRLVYSAKFLCGSYEGGLINSDGTLREGPVKPGNYQTAINVHNPQSTGLDFQKKAILLFDSSNPPQIFEQPFPPAPFVGASLNANWGLEIDCDDIRNVLLGPPPVPPLPVLPFIKGWVVIELPASFQSRLDVTAAYTSHGFTVDANGITVPTGFSEDIEQITPTFAF